MDILDILIYQPFSWLLLSLYNLTNSYGLAIILFCVVTKVVLLPFAMKSKKGMMQQSLIQPKVAEVTKKYANDKQKQQEAIGRIYQEAGISPLGGCLWSLLPLPIFFALFAVVREPITRLMGLSSDAIPILSDKILPSIGVTVQNGGGYAQLEIARYIHDHFDTIKAFIANPENASVLNGIDFSGLKDIDFSFLGLNLTVTPTLWPLSLYIILPVLSGLSAYFSQWMIQKTSSVSSQQMPGSSNMVLKLMPLMSVWFGFIMPAAMGVYWIINSITGVVQDYFLGKYYRGKFAEEEAKREAEREKKRLLEEAEKQELQRKREQNKEYQKQLTKEKKRAEYIERATDIAETKQGGRPKKGKKKAPRAHQSASERHAAAEKARLVQQISGDGRTDANEKAADDNTE